MIYDLSKQIDVQRAQRRFETLLKEQTVITLTKKAKRTLRQNSYLHLILGWFAIETGYTADETKQMYKRVNKDIYEYDKEGIPFIRSSSELSTEEMTLSIERWRNYSADKAGVYLPSANEQGFLQEIEITMSQNKHI